MGDNSQELVIRINGDIKNYQDALEKIQEKTESFSDGLKDLAKISGVAFASLTAEIGFSVKAYAGAQESTNALSQALQNQGIYSDELVEKYRSIASALQIKTGIDDDEIVNSQALLQGMIGQTEVTEKMTQAIINLSATKHIDLQSTTELIGKGIEGHTAALLKMGIQIDAHLDKEQRTAQILTLVQQKFGGTAEAANKGLGGIKGLERAFDDMQKGLGERFAPAVEVIIQKLTVFYRGISENKPLLDFIASVVIAGTAVSGVVLAVGTGAIAFYKLQAAMEAAKVATTALSLATRGLVAATGLGLVLIIVSEIYLNWSTLWPRMQQIYEAFATNVGNLTGGLSKVLNGIYRFDVASVKNGLDQMKTAISKGYDDINKEIKPIKIGGSSQDKDKLKLALEANQKEIDDEHRKQAVIQAERDLSLLKAQEASAQVIALKTQELDTLKAIADDKNAAIRADLQQHLDKIKGAEAQARTEDIQQRRDFRTEILQDEDAFNALSSDQKALLYVTEQDKLRNSLETQKSIRLSYAKQQITEDITRRNQFLLDELKFGTAYAAINNAIHSEVYNNTKSATGNLLQLQQSNNSTLKAIGKGAAIAQISIKTAESAMNIYAGFSAIPIIGPILGLAGAGAAIAFGGEQIGQVLAAAQGGLITGGIPNVDSVPVLAQQGELVVPKKNYEEVVGAVKAQRESGSSEEQASSGFAHVVISLKGNLMDFIEANLVERRSLNLSLQGSR